MSVLTKEKSAHSRTEQSYFVRQYEVSLCSAQTNALIARTKGKPLRSALMVRSRNRAVVPHFLSSSRADEEVHPRSVW